MGASKMGDGTWLCDTCLLTPEEEPTVGPSNDRTKVQFGGLMGFTGITIRSVGEGLQEEG